MTLFPLSYWQNFGWSMFLLVAIFFPCSYFNKAQVQVFSHMCNKSACLWWRDQNIPMTLLCFAVYSNVLTSGDFIHTDLMLKIHEHLKTLSISVGEHILCFTNTQTTACPVLSQTCKSNSKQFLNASWPSLLFSHSIHTDV